MEFSKEEIRDLMGVSRVDGKMEMTSYFKSLPWWRRLFKLF